MAEPEIASVPIFASISKESVALLEGGVFDVPAGQVLARAGDVGEGMFVVLAGTVVVERGDLHLEVGPGDTVGELSLLAEDPHRIARVRATTDARVLAVTRETFDRLLDTEPSFARAMLRELASRLVEARTGH